jgi:hypothetical protein
LVISRGVSAARPASLKNELDRHVAPLIERFGVGIDVGVISETSLRRAPCRVMWYDMRFGHKTLLGDVNFVPGLERFSVDRLLAEDVRNLLVNRGTLLLINRLLLECEPASTDTRRTVIKHAVKAIIGYGDALLYTDGQYHWSYAEKQRRMRSSKLGTEDFRSLYESAMEFRFQPDDEAFASVDLPTWNANLLQTGAPIHLRCEAARLGVERLTWGGYLDHALRRQLWEGMSSPRSVFTKLAALSGRRTRLGPAHPLARMGFRLARGREYLPLLFPAVAYDLDATDYRHSARSALGSSSDDLTSLTRAYLKAWGVHGDPNFFKQLDRLNLQVG